MCQNIPRTPTGSPGTSCTILGQKSRGVLYIGLQKVQLSDPERRQLYTKSDSFMNDDILQLFQHTKDSLSSTIFSTLIQEAVLDKSVDT